MPSYPRVSVIIVSWNALPLLQTCFPSVAATEYPDFEIIFADNHSTDGSSEWIARHYPAVKIVRHPDNYLFCRGNNEAIPHATGQYIVLLNNDVEVTPGWLQPLVEAAEADPAVAAVQPKLLQHRQRDHFEYAGASGGFLDRYGYPFARGRLFFTLEQDRGQYDDPRDVFWATGAALLLRQSALDKVGLLDERFVMHMEEIDLCWRLQRAGYHVRVAPQSVVYHIGGGSLARHDPRKTYFNFRNNLLLLYKNLPPADWQRIFRARVALDGLAITRTLASGRPKEAQAILKAYKDAHHLSKSYEDTRPGPEEQAVLPSYRGSIVSDYFLRSRHRFSELPPELFITS
jgi:GT2 family glycosyltransferase